MARDWSDGLSKVVRHSALEAAVGQHTQPEPDSLWNLEPVQFTEQ